MEERLEGVIVKGIGGFYYVEYQNHIYECRARGKIKQNGITPLVGDRVLIRLNNQGYVSVEEVLERKNCLIRPMVANVDQAIIVQAMTDPQPDLILLDRLILFAEYQQMEIIICFNKSDLVNSKIENELVGIYETIGYRTYSTNIKDKSAIQKINIHLDNKVNVFAGPSGVGKSSLLNALDENLNLQTGEISKRLGRGKHTTRHAELLKLTTGGWVVDTPGFSSLDMLPVEDGAELGGYFKEFDDYDYQCRFSSCRHDKEPQCAVKEAVQKGKISQSRYNSYLIFLQELNNRRKY